jgi:hypothetical protein
MFEDIQDAIDRDTLLNEMYVFVAMKHRACDPWRNALDEWQFKVEKLTGWNAYEEIENHRKNTLN